MLIRNFCAALVLTSAFGSAALADNFCVNLKTAAAARERIFPVSGAARRRLAGLARCKTCPSRWKRL